MDYRSLAGKSIVNQAESRDFSKWAIEMLEAGKDSESVAILAGLSYEHQHDTEELRQYFYKSLDELGLVLPSERECILQYAKSNCLDVISGELAPRLGVTILSSLYSDMDYDPLLSIWQFLGDDIYSLEEEGFSIFSSGLSKENVDQYIVLVAEQFMKLLEVELPNNFMWLSVCQKCGHIGEDKLVVFEKPWMPSWLFRILYGRGRPLQGVCAECGEPFPLSMRDYYGRELYLKYS